MTLRYTLARLLADDAGRETVLSLREDGWLDWQILVAMVNAAWNWRMRQAGMTPGVGDQAAAMRLARVPETPDSPEIPLDAIVGDQLDLYLHIQTVAVAKRWDLRARPESAGEGGYATF